MALRPQGSRGGSSDPPRGSTAQARLEPVVRRVVIDVLTADVVGALRAEGIPSILLKGPAFVRWLYPPGEGRSYLDTDILVPAAAMPRAERLLASMGFERLGLETIPGDWPRHAHNWLSEDGTALNCEARISCSLSTPGALAVSSICMKRDKSATLV